jgi:demethylmenaquinone methyltransferase/2-methoxy-6-polyprenyl-1,4-benzoquinol methylase
MGQAKRDSFIMGIFSTAAPVIDPLTTVFSLGLCHMWRRSLVSGSDLREGDSVLDACTGTGELALLLAEKVGHNGRVTGIDFCEEMLAIARRKIGPKFANVSLVAANAKDLDFADDTFDAATVSFGIRNIPDTAAALKEIRRVLKPGGSFVCLELTQPLKAWFVPLYKWYVFKVIPFVGKIFTKSAAPYSYLPVSIETYYNPGQFMRLMVQCGYSDVSVHSLSLGIATIYRGKKR